MYTRPKPSDNEEDIMKMQEEFLNEKKKNNNFQSSAKVVNLRRKLQKEETSASSSKQSKYAQLRGLKGNSSNPSQSPRSPFVESIIERSTEQIKNTDVHKTDNVYFPNLIPLVMGKIIEKNVETSDLPQADFHTSTCTGFPLVTKINLNEMNQRNVSYQQMDIENTNSSISDVEFTEIDRRPFNSSEKLKHNLPSQSFTVQSKDASIIHEENIKLLSKMSESEILEERAKLMTSLDPAIIKFLQMKRQKEVLSSQQTTAGLQENNLEDFVPENNLEEKAKTQKEIEGKIEPNNDYSWEGDILSHPNINQWLHFDTFEKDKLEWTKSIKDCNSKEANEPYEARFDFNGYLLPYTLEYNEQTKILFHHGKESERPGYSLLELFELTRSTMTQQRAIALATLAGILDYNSSGIYKNVIDIPLTKIFFIIRIALDDNKPIILEPALKGLRNLLFNKVDEACLDALLGFGKLDQPYLENDKSEIKEIESEESDLKDFHLAEIDLISASLRTDILQRISYILSMIKPNINCVQFCLQILTRLSRDSLETTMQIFNQKALITFIIENFIPVTSLDFMFNPSIVYQGKPILAALKYVRILSGQSRDIALELINSYNILNSLYSYIASNVQSTYGLIIQIESFQILVNIFNFKCATDSIASLHPVLIDTFNKHVQATDLTIKTNNLALSHAASSISLIGTILKVGDPKIIQSYSSQYKLLISNGIQKWFSQLSVMDSYTCSHLRLPIAILNCMQNVVERFNLPTDTGLISQFEKLFNSQIYKIISANAPQSSNLLSHVEVENSKCNIITLNSSLPQSIHKVPPTLSLLSPVPFLSYLSHILIQLNVKNLKFKFVKLLWIYISKFTGRQAFNLCDNWFTRIEVELLFNIVKICHELELSEHEKDIIYSVSNKLCYILREDKPAELDYLFRNVIFNKHWFTAERLMRNISLAENSIFSETLSKVDDILNCYIKELSPTRNQPSEIQFVKNWQNPILPRDWVYLPIVKLYSEYEENERAPKVQGAHANKVEALKAAQKETTLCCCLEWILFSEYCFSEQTNEITVTDRFCRVLCVFLCDNSLFLNNSIKILLKNCFQVLFHIQKTSNFDFDRDLTGINNFQDFYTQLVDQFQGVSYGDYMFAACILVPLAQKHNVKWRKLVWSEYAGCLRFLDCPLEYLCYDMNDYLYPIEADVSLLKSYVQALSTNLLRPNTIVFKIASHHVTMARKNKK